MSVKTHCHRFFHGGQWQGGFTPTGTLCPSVNPAICLPPSVFNSTLAVS
ncbi:MULTISPECIES: hypothetical protein [unclassified Snodgrassella]|nr:MULTISPECIES: hypothetical protein [unclassified Snodgrassella]MBI0158931.1 hypothetical protein [Snodgrassella sp. W6238H11]MBI0161116.1 hypothetical protein [Snodgrassella sp. W6238H14]